MDDFSCLLLLRCNTGRRLSILTRSMNLKHEINGNTIISHLGMKEDLDRIITEAGIQSGCQG